MLHTYGTMAYGPGMMATVHLCDDFTKYYRALLPKYLMVQPPKYKPHISVVRLNIEKPINILEWGKHAGRRIDIKYDSTIKNRGVYYYIQAYSEQIGIIRRDLGLSTYRNGFYSYHITIGNTKNV